MLLRLMRPPVRPPQLRCVFFSSMYLPHLLVLPATFWTSVPFATLSVFPSLICGSCPSGQRFAYSFFQIPSHGGHPCCSAMCFVVAYAHLGLSPIRKRPCWANKRGDVQPSAVTSPLVKLLYINLVRLSVLVQAQLTSRMGCYWNCRWSGRWCCFRSRPVCRC